MVTINSKFTRFATRLRHRQAELLRTTELELEELQHRSGSAFDAGVGEYGEVDADDIAAGLADVACRELEQINDALARLADGTFGVCTDCGGRIARSRLVVIPYVSKCRHCQEIAETGETRRARPR